MTLRALPILLAAIATLTACSRGPKPVVMATPTMAGPVSVYGGTPMQPISEQRPAAIVALRQHTFLADGADADVSLDPSGTWLTYTSTRHSPRPKIYIQKVDGITVTQLTTDDADDANPVFSPDGKWIAFASNRSGHWSLYTMDVEGRNVVQVTNTHGQRTHDIHPSFSPDGSQLAFASLTRNDLWEICTVDLKTGARRMIGEGLFPAWCPDKGVNRIAFQKPRKQGTWLYSIWTMDLENGEPRRLTEVATSATAALVTPAWSPDGSHLTYATITNTNAGAQHDLWVVNTDGTNRRRLTDGVATALAPTFSPDNRVFFISNRAGAESIWSVSAAPTAPSVALKIDGKGEHSEVAEKPGSTEHAEGAAAVHAETKDAPAAAQHATTETP